MDDVQFVCFSFNVDNMNWLCCVERLFLDSVGDIEGREVESGVIMIKLIWVFVVVRVYYYGEECVGEELEVF